MDMPDATPRARGWTTYNPDRKTSPRTGMGRKSCGAQNPAPHKRG